MIFFSRVTNFFIKELPRFLWSSPFGERAVHLKVVRNERVSDFVLAWVLLRWLLGLVRRVEFDVYLLFSFSKLGFHKVEVSSR